VRPNPDFFFTQNDGNFVDVTLLCRLSPEDVRSVNACASFGLRVRELRKNGGYCGSQYCNGCGQVLLMVHGNHRLLTCVGIKEQIDQRSWDSRKVTFAGMTCEMNISHALSARLA
jgi:hypothetical protein